MASARAGETPRLTPKDDVGDRGVRARVGSLAANRIFPNWGKWRPRARGEPGYDSEFAIANSVASARAWGAFLVGASAQLRTRGVRARVGSLGLWA